MKIQMDSLVSTVLSMVLEIFFSMTEVAEDNHVEMFHDIELHMVVLMFLTIGFMVHHTGPSVFDSFNNIFHASKNFATKTFHISDDFITVLFDVLSFSFDNSFNLVFSTSDFCGDVVSHFFLTSFELMHAIVDASGNILSTFFDHVTEFSNNIGMFIVTDNFVLSRRSFMIISTFNFSNNKSFFDDYFVSTVVSFSFDNINSCVSLGFMFEGINRIFIVMFRFHLVFTGTETSLLLLFALEGIMMITIHFISFMFLVFTSANSTHFCILRTP